MLDRSETSRAVAKIIAYQQAGKRDSAKEWATILYRLLLDEGLLD